MAPRNSRQEAFEAGFKNPLIGDIGPLQRLYGTVSAIGEELGGGDMGTPFGQRFAERQTATKAEVKRLQALREKHPEEFGRGMMQAQERMDPYMLTLGTGTLGSMRPLAATNFQPAYGETPVGMLEGPGAMRALPAPEAAPVAPYYRSVPAEMGTSPSPMSAYNQNMYGMTTGRYGSQGAQYMPEMAVTDFESYAPGGVGRTSPETWGRPISKFDENMLAAFRQGRFNRMGGRASPGGDYTPEEMGSAMVPYRQGGLVYEPVGAPMQGGARQIGGPQGVSGRIGYDRGPLEGEWSEVYGLGGPRGAQGAPYTGSMDFGVTRDGMAASPTGMRFDPRIAAAAIGGGAGYMAGLPREEMQQVQPAGRAMAMLPPIDVRGARASTALSGISPAAPAGFAGPTQAPAAAQPAPQPRKQQAGRGKAAKQTGGQKAADQKAAASQAQGFEPNLNYLVTKALDDLLGQGNAELGRQYQEYYATHPWPY